MCHDTNVLVWGANLRREGVWKEGFMRRFLGQWRGGSGCVASLEMWRPTFVGFSLGYSPLRDSGSVPLRWLDFKHFVHCLMSMEHYFSNVEHYAPVNVLKKMLHSL